MGDRTYHGKIIEKMPELIKSGKVPMSIYDHILWRIDALKSKDENKIHEACRTYYDSGDMIFTGGYGNSNKFSGSIILDLDSQIGRGIRKEIDVGGIRGIPNGEYVEVNKILLPKNDAIYQGGVRIDDKTFKNLRDIVESKKGLTLSKENVGKLSLYKHKKIDDLLKDKIIMGLLRNDEKTLKEYFELSIDYLAEMGYKYNDLMGVSIKTNSEFSVGYFVSISKLIANSSNIYASVSIEASGGNLRGKYKETA